MLLANFNGKEHLRHRAVSLQQHGFLVRYPMTYKTSTPAIRIARTATQSRRTKDSRLDKQFGHFFEIIFSLSIIAFSLEDFHCSVSVPFYCVP